MDPEIEAIVRRYAEALQATNVALNATISELENLKQQFRNFRYQTAERFMLLECGQVLEEVEEGKVPPTGRQH